MTSRKGADPNSDNPVVQTGGQLFSDGAILDVVRTAAGELNLLHWNGKSAETAAHFVRDGKTFVPMHIDPTVLRLMRLPGNIAEYGSTRSLFTEISEFISWATKQPARVAQTLTFFVFADWLTESLTFAPCLWIAAPPATTPAPVMLALRLLSRRALTVTDISTAGFRALPMDLQPTLLTEVFQPTRRLLNLLRGSTRRGALIAANGKAVDTSCAKIVFAPAPLRDPADAGFPLELVLSPMREYVPAMNPSEAERIGAEFQAKLLHYRLSNFTKVRAPSFDVSQFCAPMQELAYGLGACIVDDEKLQAQIVPLLNPLDGEIRVSHASLLPAIVLEELLDRCHKGTGKHFSVMELTVGVNTILVARGETLVVSPEDVGWQLRGLGLRTIFIAGGRKGLVLSNEVHERVHELAAAYGVRTLRAPSAKVDCPLCAAIEQDWKIEAAPGPGTKHGANGGGGQRASNRA